MIDEKNTQNLHKTIRFFETFLRASADGIVITDSAKNIIFVNDTFCKFFLSNRQDVLETNLFVWFGKLSPNAHDTWEGLESQIHEYGIARDVEFAMKTGEGMRYFSVNSSLLEKIDIEETGIIISIWRDDTERKMAKEVLQRSHDELEMRVKERTEQLTNINIELRNQINERNRAEEELQKHKDHLEELVRKRTSELEKRNAYLETYNEAFVGRELRMVELKKIIASHEKKISEYEKEINKKGN